MEAADDVGCLNKLILEQDEEIKRLEAEVAALKDQREQAKVVAVRLIETIVRLTTEYQNK